MRKRSSLEDIYYWLSILLIITGAGYFVAQGVDTDTSLPTPIEAGDRLEAFRQTIEDDSNIIAIDENGDIIESEEEIAL